MPLNRDDMLWSHRIDIARAKRRRRRFRAPVVAITGSSGKSTTTALLAHILEGHGTIGQQVIDNGPVSIAWSLLRTPPNVDYIVLETGVGGPGDMDPLVDLVQPDVAIVTLVASEHYKNFRGEEAVAAEKGKLVAALKPGGLALLNGDDPWVAGMARLTDARIVRFGQGPENDYRFDRVEVTTAEGLSLVLQTPNGELTLRSASRAAIQAPCFAAAAAAALELGVPPAIVQDRMATFDSVRERFEYLRLENGAGLVIDTAKAPHHSLHATFAAFGALEAPVKRIVIGQVSDTSTKARQLYRDAINEALTYADRVILVGEHPSRIGRKHPRRDLLDIFDAAEGASRHIRETIRDDELILLKSSRILHIERIALDLQTNGGVNCWKPTCDIKYSCKICGLYREPPEQHEAAKRRKKRDDLMAAISGIVPGGSRRRAG